MGQVSVGLRLDEDLLARIDRARGDVPRARWIARACEAFFPFLPAPTEAELEASRRHEESWQEAERLRLRQQALSETKEPSKQEQADPGSVSPVGGVRSAAPAEQSYRSSSFAKRDVRPVPKRGA